MAAIVRGGGETFDLQIADALQRRGHEVEFLSGRPLLKLDTGCLMLEAGNWKQGEGRSQQQYKGSVKHQVTSIKFHLLRSPYLGWFPWDKVRGGWRLRTAEFRLFEWLAVRWIMRHGAGYDVIQICELPYVVAELKKRNFNRPVVMRLTGPNYDEYGNAVQKADGIIASGTTIATVMQTKRPDAVNVPNCVDSRRFRPMRAGHFVAGCRLQVEGSGLQDSGFRAQHGIGEDVLVLLYVARLQGFKDHETLIRAFALVHKQIKKCRLVLAGSGHIAKTIHELVRELGLDDAVIMLGETDFESLPEVYAAADIKVISSIYESFCFAALEGMATALPIVTTDNGWVPQLLGREDPLKWGLQTGMEMLLPGYDEPDDGIREYAGGLVVPKRSPERLAKAVVRLAKDPEKRRAMGRRNREEVVEKYNWEKSAEILEGLYKYLTTRSS
jgi:glycosyltransferase involved in cell wall biosynthesis